MRLGRNIATAFLGLLLAASTGFISAAQADTDSTTTGVNGGKPIKAYCRPGEALVGLVYNSGQMMYAIGPVCRPIANGAFTGPVRKGDNVFGAPDPEATSHEPVVCPDGDAVATFSVFLLPNLRVHHVRAVCYPVKGEGQGTILKATEAVGTVEAHGSAGCPTHQLGHYATGIIGSYSGSILSLGLRCHAPEDDASNTDTGDTNTADTDTTNTDTGDNGDNGNTVTIQITPPDLKLFPKPGPNGGTRTVRSATTLYSKPAGKELAYLNPGDQVKIIACDDKGWCQVSKPKGYIWGDDLDQ